MQKWLVSIISHHWITPGVLFLSLVLLTLLYRKRHRLCIHPAPVVLSGLIVLMGAFAVYLNYLRPIEMIHFLIFSLLGWLSVTAFGSFWGCVAMLSIATGDEVLQYFLPDRVGDLHDVLINSLSGLLGAWLGNKQT